MVGRLGDNISTPQGLYGLLRTVQEYNIAAQQMKQPVFDTALLGQYLKSGETTLTKSNTGGAINWYVVKKNGGKFSDGSFMKPVMKETVTMKPGEVANLKFRWAKMQNDNQQKDLDRKAKLAAASMRGGGGRSSGGGSGKSSGGDDLNNHDVGSTITKMIADGHSPSYIYTYMMDHSMNQREWEYYWNQAKKYYHEVNGDEASEDYSYLDGDGNPTD